MAERKRIGILISGRGSNMVALVEAMHAGTIAADPAVVLSNVADAAGLDRARGLGVPTALIEHRRAGSRAAHEAQVLDCLRRHDVGLVCLAGYMRILGPTLVGAYPNSILNVHPSLLPAFPGLDAQRQAVEHGVKLSGCTVHFVDLELDHGPIVLQAAVPVLEDDTESTLASRILEAEHRIYPEAVALCAADRLGVDRRVVRIRAGR